MRATLWKDDYQRVNSHFKRGLKGHLKNDIQILFGATINFVVLLHRFYT